MNIQYTPLITANKCRTSYQPV